MICKRIYLTEDKRAYFDTYIQENSVEMGDHKKRPAIVVCPGGGYFFTSDREAEPIALSYAAKGYHAFVLRYSCGEYAAMPAPLNELAKTVYTIREHSEEWNIDPDKIVLTGFSAGAHLAACLGVFWNKKEILTEYDGKRESIKPNGLIICYPVIDLFSSTNRLDIGVEGYPEYDQIDYDLHKNVKPEEVFVRENGKTYVDFETHMNAFIFNGTNYTKEQEEFYSLQNHVSKDTPPTFIWHTSKDGLILPANSLKFATALYEHEVPFEIHMFGEGGHGLALANDVTEVNPWDVNKNCEPWLGLAVTWLKTLFGKE
ncbi:MAG: alpha/beta hydrolase [bacterium]|nr:alpha/beta hydrolase [bacterium]